MHIRHTAICTSIENKKILIYYFVPFQVMAGSIVKGFLEPKHDAANWLKSIRTVYTNHEANIQSFLVGDYVGLYNINNNLYTQ